MNAQISQQKPLFSRVVIVGVGLIGGSIALAAKKSAAAERIVGVGRARNRMQTAVELGIIDEAETDLKTAVANADLVIVCTPVDRIADDISKALVDSSSKCLVTDAGSTKGRILQDVGQLAAESGRYIGSHPLAGSEKTGFENATADLYQEAVVVVTPVEENRTEHVQKIEQFWQSLGARVVSMTAPEHDQILGLTSHLPHLVASTLANTVGLEHLSFAATGYADTTRIAAGDPHLWTSIFLENPQATLAAVQQFQQSLKEITSAIESADADRLNALLKTAADNRSQWKP